jgi:hypothetical protein
MVFIVPNSRPAVSGNASELATAICGSDSGARSRAWGLTAVRVRSSMRICWDFVQVGCRSAGWLSQKMSTSPHGLRTRSRMYRRSSPCAIRARSGAMCGLPCRSAPARFCRRSSGPGSSGCIRWRRPFLAGRPATAERPGMRTTMSSANAHRLFLSRRASRQRGSRRGPGLDRVGT